ncbi:hypothetical protein ABFS83_09G009100 [Erythranthe nasuta]
MNPCPYSVLLLFVCLLNTITASSCNPTHSTGDVSVNCGSSATSAAQEGREWLGDLHPKLSPLLQIKGSSVASSVISADDPVPYKTGRLSRSRFSYTFQVNPGQKFIRLHFNPAPYKGFKMFNDLFDVEAGSFTLLRNFSASLTANALGVNSFVKEFCLHVEENEQLVIVFSSSSSESLGTYAFINGIEIISVPPSLSYFHKGDFGVQVIGKSLVYVDNNIALEIIDRVNVKHDSVLSSGSGHDMILLMSGGTKRKASKINNITWKISVGVGFKYLVRLHFSELGFKIAKIGGVNFTLRINEKITDINIDMVREKDDEDSILSWFRDYMVMMKGNKEDGKRDLVICLQSDDEFMDGHGPVKGFEIMKLSYPDNSLASPNPAPSSHESSYRTRQNLHKVLGHRNMVATAAITLLVAVNIILYISRQIWEASCIEGENKPSARANQLCRRFSLDELQLATEDFSELHLIGRGGFGRVYKGLIDNERKTVAIKRQKLESHQGSREFLTEIETLTELRHVNLVSLIGYCNEHGEMILVYEYMACGTLADHLYKRSRKGKDHLSLTWKQRLTICIGAGRGLDYLHTGHSLIHRDVKASNILLDENFVAKVSDFGLAKYLSTSKLQQSHVSTKVKGTVGYFDPNYFSTGKLTVKSDTYAFGVMLLEVLSGRPTVDPKAAEDERILTKWARGKISNGNADQIIASNMKGEILEDSLKEFVGVAESCLHDEPRKRLTMAQVVRQLEFALELQEISKSSVPNGITSVEEKENMPSARAVRLCRRFSLAEIQLATGNFSDAHLIGRGGFGNVYKGLIDNGVETVAIKRQKLESRQGAHEFLTEIETLTELRHVNLVTLVGYCNEHGEMILVYEYMACGTLSDHLFKHANNSNDCPSLNWKQRLAICIGAGRGLDYLHTGHSLIHRDVKASNILLDDNFIAKVSDFGLAKHLSRTKLQSYVSTKVKGTFGYLDPNYFTTGKLTRKSDTYAFGVVLLEVLSGRPALDLRAAEDKQTLTKWARNNIINGKADQIVASNLLGEISEDSLKAFVEVAERCLRDEPKKRPTMAQVVLQLEFALERNETSNLLPKRIASDAADIHPSDEENNSSISTGKLTMESMDAQNLTLEERTNSNVVNDKPQSGRKDGRKDATHKTSRYWPFYPLKRDYRATEAAKKDKKTINMLSTAAPAIAIPVDELRTITGNFGLNCLIGEGSYGMVYRGIMKTGQVAAIKKLDSIDQPNQEFLAQVLMMSSLRHENMVELLGYHVAGDLQVLAYEFAPHMSLQDILHGRKDVKGFRTVPFLSWAQRVKIAVGAAKGLKCIHEKGQIHDGVKSSNVLIFGDYDIAKIADFGLSNLAPQVEVGFPYAVYPRISGGYRPPEYGIKDQLSWRCDVYSFGVILVELLTGCKPAPTKPEEKNLVRWVTERVGKGNIKQFVDAALNGNYPPDAVAEVNQLLFCSIYLNRFYFCSFVPFTYWS